MVLPVKRELLKRKRSCISKSQEFFPNDQFKKNNHENQKNSEEEPDCEYENEREDEGTGEEEETSDNEEEEEEISKEEEEEENNDTSSVEHYDYDEQEDEDEDGDEGEDSYAVLHRLTNLSIVSSDKMTHNTRNSDDNGAISLDVKFSRDYLWKRHLICRSEIGNFGEEDMEFRMWRLETRLGQALIHANRKWARILSFHVPHDCSPAPIPLAEQLINNDLQWSDKVVEIILCWLHCGDDGYCLMQTEKELLETQLAVEQMLSAMEEDNLGQEDENIAETQRYSLRKLQESLRPLGQYIQQLVEDGKEHLPMDRRFRVNQMCNETLQKLDEGEYGYAFFGTSVVPYRHGVVWEGLHVFKEGHVFAQDITLNIARHEQEKQIPYLKYEEIAGFSFYGLERAKHQMFRLVFVCDPETEVRSVYAFFQRARKITENAARDSSEFESSEVKKGHSSGEVQEFLVGISNADISIRKRASELNLLELEQESGWCVYGGDLEDLLKVLCLDNGSAASLIVRNPTLETFVAIYSCCEVMGYSLEHNVVTAGALSSETKGLIQCILGKTMKLNSWRQAHSPRSILELVKR